MRIRAVENLEPMSGETVLLDDTGSEGVAKKVIESSIVKYTKLYVKRDNDVVINSTTKRNKDNNRAKDNDVVLKDGFGRVKQAVGKK